MPIYTYSCECGYERVKRASYEETTIRCPRCGEQADRAPFYRSHNIRTEEATIPPDEPSYQNESDKKSLKLGGWDYDRALEHIRANVYEDDKGNRVFDAEAANRVD